VLHWVAAGWAMVTGWAFGRALNAGLWSARVVVPVLLVAAAIASPFPGSLVLVGAAAAAAGLAWWPATELAVNPIVPQADGVAVPPQLVPPEILSRAGFDDRGRRVDRER